MKSEPESYSIDDLARDGSTSWDGVRNYQARNLMRDEMKLGDQVLFYHSGKGAGGPGVTGIARVSAAAHADATALEKHSDYYDAKATRDEPIWMMVDIAFVEKFDAVVPLSVLRNEKQLEGMPLLQRGQRLSVQPVSAAHFKHVCRLAKKMQG